MYEGFSKGYVEIIVGPMYSGKSEELIRRLKRVNIAKRKLVTFKHSIDDRYEKTKLASHAGNTIEATILSDAKDMYKYVDDTVEVVGIDEVQFFDDFIIDVIDNFAKMGIRVIVAGLDMDFKGDPFSVVPTILAKAEFVTKLTAICTVCGAPATRTQRLIDGVPAHYNDPTVLVGATESYTSRCRKHHQIRGINYGLQENI